LPHVKLRAYVDGVAVHDLEDDGGRRDRISPRLADRSGQ
jgi:hypothetical protein